MTDHLETAERIKRLSEEIATIRSRAETEVQSRAEEIRAIQRACIHQFKKAEGLPDLPAGLAEISLHESASGGMETPSTIIRCTLCGFSKGVFFWSTCPICGSKLDSYCLEPDPDTLYNSIAHSWCRNPDCRFSHKESVLNY